jgi:hypothetical protein
VTGAERRIHRRFDLALPMRVRVRTQTHQTVETSTKDISARGIYFSLSGNFELGSELECEVTLPPELCQGNSIQVKVKGRIVRVERSEEDTVGVAATIEDYEFIKTL